MRSMIVVLFALLLPLAPANAQVGIAFSAPGVSIGINMPAYPDLVPIPGYPVYYDPQVSSNYFFYDGLYWVYSADNWYASTWYNGPWQAVAPQDVPVYVLRIPVRYYRQPPVYFHGWSEDAPPRWGEHWGNDWASRHAGWDRWDRHSAPAAAPLPVYQRQYSGDRYPRAIEQQQTLRVQNYHYQPREAVTRQEFQHGNAGTARNASPQPAAASAQPANRTSDKPRVQAEHKAPAAAVREKSPPNVAQHQPAVAEQQPRQVPRAQQAQHAKPVPQQQQQQQAQRVEPVQHAPQGQPAQHVQRVQPTQHGPAPQAQQAAQPKGQHPAAAGGPEHKAPPQQHEAAKNNNAPSGAGKDNRGGGEKQNQGKQKEEHN